MPDSFGRSRLRNRGLFNLAGFYVDWETEGAALLAVFLGALTIMADFLQVRSAGGLWVWLAFLTIIVTACLVLLFVGPILRNNIRGRWLFSSLRQTGLIDVENRADLTHRLPPVETSRCTQGPLLISGILDQLFQNHREEIVAFLPGNGELRVLLLHPRRAGDSLESMWVRHQKEWVSYWQTNCNEAQVAIDAIIDAGLDKMRGFHLRFFTEIPPFFGMLAGAMATGVIRPYPTFDFQ